MRKTQTNKKVNKFKTTNKMVKRTSTKVKDFTVGFTNEIYKVIHQSNKNKNDNIVRVRYIKNLYGTKQITVTKFNGADNIHSGCFPYTSTHIRFID